MSHLGSDESILIKVKSLSNDNITQHQLPLSHWRINPKKPELIKSLGIKPFIPPIIPIIANTPPDYPAAKSGMKPGDKIISIDGRPVDDWQEMVDYVQKRPYQVIQVRVTREGRPMTFSIKTAAKKEDGKLVGILGVQANSDQWLAKYVRLDQEPPIAAMGRALEQTWDLSSSTLIFIGRMVTGKLSLHTISGPVGIAQGAGDSGRSGIVYYLLYLAIVSVSLGVLNLLPIPMLDGGHLVFFVIEGVRGKPAPPAFQMTLSYIGLGLLFMLMGLAVTNDLARIFS